jgi:GntR family transcriptional regulator of vanillate catabolism
MQKSTPLDDSPSLQARVLMQLRDWLISGKFEAGERLAEIPLAERLGASRTPVRAALQTLAAEGLVLEMPTGGYQVRKFTAREVADAIRLRGVLEGYAARLVAQHGVTRQLSIDLRHLLDQGDRILRRSKLDVEASAAYAEMNDQFHRLIVQACGNEAVQRSLEATSHLPFAPPSGMLPMQAGMADAHDWLRYAHRQHHMLVAAMQAGDGARAQALGEEHVQVALMNFEHALSGDNEVARKVPAFRLVAEV